MSFPTFKLYQENGSTLVYEFINVTDKNPILNSDEIDSVEHNALRGVGSIISEGSEEPYDLTIQFILIAQGQTDQDKYIDLITRMKAIKTAIQTGTKYVLKMQTSLSETEDTNVKRIGRIEFPLDNNQKVLNFQRVSITFRANVWS